jgi:AraC-like DNA-binding protein
MRGKAPRGSRILRDAHDREALLDDQVIGARKAAEQRPAPSADALRNRRTPRQRRQRMSGREDKHSASRSDAPLSTLEVVLPARPLPFDGIRAIGFRSGASFSKRIFPWPWCGIVLNCTTSSFQSVGLAENVSGLVGGMALHVGQVRGSAIDCLEVQVSPLVAAAVLDVSPVELNNPLIALDEIWGAEAERLRSQLVEAESWDRRFALVHEGLAKRYRESHHVDPEIADAWRRILRTGGQVAVARLAQDYGWSRTRFWRRFKTQVGVSPKRAARIVRFDRALRMIGADADLAAVAGHCGYADQSHLNRDFLDFAATTPGELRDDPLWSGDPSWILDGPPERVAIAN